MNASPSRHPDLRGASYSAAHDPDRMRDEHGGLASHTRSVDSPNYFAAALVHAVGIQKKRGKYLGSLERV